MSQNTKLKNCDVFNGKLFGIFVLKCRKCSSPYVITEYDVPEKALTENKRTNWTTFVELRYKDSSFSTSVHKITLHSLYYIAAMRQYVLFHGGSSR